MEIQTHQINDTRIAELISAALIIDSVEDGINLLGDLYYQDFESIVIHEKNITPRFFELKNGMAGEILQKFSNYRVRLAIVGDFEIYSSKSLRDFIHESNQGKQVSFVGSVSEALAKLSR